MGTRGDDLVAAEGAAPGLPDWLVRGVLLGELDAMAGDHGMPDALADLRFNLVVAYH